MSANLATWLCDDRAAEAGHADLEQGGSRSQDETLKV